MNWPGGGRSLGLRIITALTLGSLFIGGIFLLPTQGFQILTGAFLLLGGWELAGLCKLRWPARALTGLLLVLLAAGISALDLSARIIEAGGVFWALCLPALIGYTRTRRLWTHRAAVLTAGALMLLPAWCALGWLRSAESGAWLVIWVMAMVWMADIGAYFCGHSLGRHKLAPVISPGKTVEGLIGGVIVALATSVLMTLALPIPLPLGWLLIAISLAIIAASVLGDLMESLLKRARGAKDSGHLLPGHGGILDRIDSVLAAAPVAALLLPVGGVIGGNG